MAVFTPRGLKIRLEVDYCFALIARLYPQAGAFKVLKTTEGLELVPSFLAFVTGLVCFSLKFEPIQIGLFVLFASLIGFLITLAGFYVIPGLPTLSTLFSYISAFGIVFIFLTIFGFVLVGWQGVVGFFAGRLVGWIINTLLDNFESDRIYKKTGAHIFGSERNFLNAYRLHAAKLGKTTDVYVSDDELKSENWKRAFNEFARKWPEVVKRYNEN